MSFDLAAVGLLLAAAVVTVVVAFGLTLVVARVTGRHSVVDVTWGLGFVAVAAVSFVLSGVLGTGNGVVRTVVLALVAAWGCVSRSTSGGATTARARTPATPRCSATTTPPVR